MNQKLPSDALTKPTRRVPWILGGIGAVAIAAAAVVAGPSIAATLNPAPAPTPTPTMTPYVSALTQDELDSVQHGAEVQAAIIAADKAAAEKAAADAAAADAAANAAHHSSDASGPVRCPAGSSANSSDGVNDTSCFPTICFGITVPDPAHPECNVAFKP